MTPWEQIPQELKTLNQWLTWCYELREGKKTKVPVNPHTGEYASVTNPKTWGSFEQARAAVKNGNAGIGFVFTAADPYMGIDLDGCFDADGLHPQGADVVRRLDSYSERSVSGNGLHIILKGKLPPGGRRKGKLEMYDAGRFFVMTGNHLESTPLTIEPRQAELEALHAKIFPPPPPKPQAAPPAMPSDLSDFAIVDKAKSARNGHKFSQLWAGDTTGYPSASEATAALLEMLVFWTGPDPERLDRLFRQSGLMREKWDRPQSGSTWGALEIEKAIARATEFYTPAKQPLPQAPAPQPFPKTKPAVPTICFVTGRELELLEFKEPTWIVPGILPEGLCLFSARPKKGKTWWAMSVALAVAAGGCALGKAELRVSQGKALYLCLEDKLRRAKKRLKKILEDEPLPGDLILAETWPRLDKGGLDALRDFLKEHDDCKLVVIDSFAKVKPPRPKNADAYDFDMSVGSALQALAQERAVCILLVYHTRKAEADDPLDEVIGSTGLTGAVDAVLILRRGRGQADATLFVTGRDVEEQELALKFHPQEGLWELMGTAAECAISRERQEILSVLKETGPQTPAQLAKIINKSRASIKMSLLRMKGAGLVKINNKGEYLSI
jgi:putative DNA primase/helicase